MSAQLALALPRDPRDLSDLAPRRVVEARVRRRQREDRADALPQTAACTCGGPAVRNEDGEPVCAACGKPSGREGLS